MEDAQGHTSEMPDASRSVEVIEVAPPPLPPASPIAGFWRRLFAYVIDRLILGAAGYVAGIFLFETLMRTGPWGRLIGFGIALLYFGTLNSGLAGGQTLGKRLLKIKVVGEDGAGLPLVWSWVRAAILALPTFLSGVMLPSDLMTSWINTMMAFVAFGLSGALIYLFIFNRATRQSLHDLAVSSFVVRAESVAAPPAPPLWWLHGVVVGLWMLVALGVSVKLSPDPAASRDLLEARQGIDQIEHVRSAVVYEMTFGARMIIALAVYDAVPANLEQAATEIAGIVLDACPQRAPEEQVIVVKVQCGYDLGICSSWKAVTVYKAPKDWEKAIKAGAK